ncbi:MAG TPA: glycosyltransferase [Anaerolineaceae bacterium]|nr:glycosyltransferase [Anaerolineaceae bacterium]
MSLIFPKQNFLILTSDTGFGHRSAANAIAKALELQHPQDSTAVIVNPVSEEPGSPLFLSEQNYDRLVTNNPNFYRFTYEVSDSRPASGLVENTLTLALYRTLKQLIQEMRPDAILSTRELFSGPTGAVLNTMKNRPPFYTVVTDLANVHAMWFNGSPDRFFVASEAVRSKAIDCGIDPQKICISGIPVDPDFASIHTPKSELKKKLGLDPNLPALLFVGSRRVSGIIEHLQALETVPMLFQVAVIAGGDNDLYDEVNRRKWSFPLLAQGYVTNMPEWMLSADLLITKAGGLILSEGLAAGLPILMIDYLPGQEEGNVRFILDQQAGEFAKKPGELSDLVSDWLKDDQKILKTIASNARRTGHPDAALVTADALWQAGLHQADETSVPKARLHLNLRSHLEDITGR